MSLSWILWFPLLGFLINGAWYLLAASKSVSDPHGESHREDAHHATIGGSSKTVGGIATTAIFGAFIVSLATFLQLKGLPESERVIEQQIFEWFKVGALKIDFTLRVDPLSSLFTLVITGVGTLIHLYSIGYMGHDASPGKFFAYLNLFCLAMLVLVTGGSLPVLFLGWEGVGLCSYLLIGFWYTDMEKSIAGMKAFVVNRVGDLGFLLGLFLLFGMFGTVDFVEMKSHALAMTTTGLTEAQSLTVTAACLLMFLGCTGKSAQIPLYVWLPDAMAGPTPVSALIHAATMVTSGIYLIARMNFLYSMSDTALHVVAWVGALTAFVAATIAIAQNDIKKVLAYSTVSQLGYMFLGVGVASYTAGVFHVITHAFFKALLFLGAGSVIHGMHEEQDILKMGGLKKHMPQTYLVFMIGWLAICGLPPFSGFFSKDEILWKTFSSHHGSKALWFIAAVTAVMTAFYMTRLFYLTFLGKERFDVKKVHPHESPFVMTGPLFVLAALSAVGGFIGIPHMSWLDHWLSPVIPEHEHVQDSMEWVLMALSVLGAAAGIVFSFRTYRDLSIPQSIREKWSKLYRALNHKWFVDETYEATIVAPLVRFSKFLWKKIDVDVIDRIIVGFARVSGWTGQVLRVSQTGLIQTYAVVFIVGFLAMLGYVIYGLL